MSRDFLFLGVYFEVVGQLRWIGLESIYWRHLVRISPDYARVWVYGGDAVGETNEDGFRAAVSSADVEIFGLTFVVECDFPSLPTLS